MNVFINENITNEDIDVCNKDPNLYFFIIGPQYIVNLSKNECLQKTGKDLNPLPKNKYILYQIEQLNQIDNKWNNLENIKDILDKSYAIFDYSTINLQYYPENVRENVKLLAPLIEVESPEDEESEYAKAFVNNIFNNILKTTKTKSEINILFIGTMNDRREKILNKIKDKGYNVKILSQTIGKELIDEIKKSDIVLNLHYYPNSLLEIFRIHDVLPYNCKILSENPGTQEEMDLVEKYKKVVSFFPVINDDLSNIDNMYKLIDDNFNNEIKLANASAIAERKKFIDEVNRGNNELLFNCAYPKINILIRNTYRPIF